MTARTTAIEVHDLGVSYGDLVAVDGISFSVETGTVVALLGPNGAGKTTTVEVLEGYRAPDRGRVRVLGLDPIADHDTLVRRAGVMLQDGGVYTNIHPDEVLHLFASYYPDPADPEELLARVGLLERRHSSWRRLSGGEQQRLAMALALVGRPELTFLDEPTAGVDPQGRQLIRRTIADLRDEGVTVLLTTHDLDEAEKLADKVVIVDRGQVLAEGTPAELTAMGDQQEIRFGAAPGIDRDQLGAALGGSVAEVAPGEYRAAVAPTPAAVAALTAWLAARDLPLADLRAGRHTLEDVFLRLTAEASAAGPAAPDGTTDTGARSGRGRRARRRGGRR